ncbi:ABC transporter [Zhengella mangrovi]|uniref:ABC transporter n=2 Tax=Zhengella mangrovi TaxID=1982044 RepID=A0A2G1QL09_9HYPH|nr:ABC transporter [Zhengella mangrovi]
MDIKAAGATANWDADPVLTVEHLTMRFGGLVAINDLSFNVGRGDITALIGPNGAGKTTVFNCVTGFYKPTEGRIVMRHGPGRQSEAVETLTDTNRQWDRTANGAVYLLERMPDFEISAHAKVARTFQNIRLFSGMTVLENLLVAQHNMLMKASNFTVGGLLGLSGYRKAEKSAIDKAVYWLEQTNLIERADDPAGDLPYGAQRRLEIARAMCSNPHLLCLDEPAAGLNPRESADLNDLLQYIRREHKTSVLLIEHDMGVVMEISDHIVVLDYGQKISDGDAESVRNDPKVIAAYLGVDDEEEIEDPEIISDLKGSKDGAKPASADKPQSPVAAMSAHAATGQMPGAAAAAKDAEPEARATKADTAGSDLPGDRPASLDAPQGDADNLTRIKGIGPGNEKKLNALGIYHFSQIAAWTPSEVQWVGAYLAFPGRIEREDWTGQASQLAAGGDTEFSRRVDAGKVSTSRAGKGKTGGKA